MRLHYHFILFAFLFCGRVVKAQELGEWQVTRFQLQSGLGGPHVKALQSSLFDSFLQLNWQLAPFYDFRVEWGDRQYLRSPIWSQAYAIENQEFWGIRQAYLQFQNDNLGFKVGYLPTAFGSNSLTHSSSEVSLPQLAWAHHLWGLAANSVQLSFKYDEWQSQLQMLPEKTGYTVLGHFSYRPVQALGLDLGIWTTRQEPSYFNTQSYWADLGWVAPAQSWSHIRLTHATLSRFYQDLHFIGEWGQGEFFATNQNARLNWNLFDLRYYIWPKVGALLRVDRFLDERHTDIGITVRPTKFGAHWLLFLRQNQRQELSLWWWIKIRNF